MRTKISNCKRLIVHFFDARQRNEPKKTRIRDCRPLCIPATSRATTKRLWRLAKSHAAVAQQKLCFRRLKEDGENIGDFYGKEINSGRGGPWSSRSNAKQIYTSFLWGRGPTWVLALLGQNRIAKKFIQYFSKSF